MLIYFFTNSLKNVIVILVCVISFFEYDMLLSIQIIQPLSSEANIHMNAYDFKFKFVR